MAGRRWAGSMQPGRQEARPCAICGMPATDVVKFVIRGAIYEKDLCAAHLAELIEGARTQRRAPVRDHTAIAVRQSRRSWVARQERATPQD
jgi:hypothetical protein